MPLSPVCWQVVYNGAMDHPANAIGPDVDALTAPLLALCRQAGARILEHYHAAGTPEIIAKPDDTPLTRADLDSHRVIEAGLSALAPSIPILSEESSETELAGRREWQRFWLVDPLDGTKEFIARTGEFTINIALVADGRPELGMIYVPMTGESYVGIPGSGAWLIVDSLDERKPLRCQRLVAGSPLRVLASRRHKGQRLSDCLDWLSDQWGPIERVNSGSALKFCDMARGEGDFYPRFSLCSEWDVAAGDAIVTAAGGAVLGLDGQPLRYNQRDTLLSENFLGVANPTHPLWSSLIESLEL